VKDRADYGAGAAGFQNAARVAGIERAENLALADQRMADRGGDAEDGCSGGKRRWSLECRQHFANLPTSAVPARSDRGASDRYAECQRGNGMARLMVSCNLNKAGHRRRSTARVSKAGIYRAPAWLAWLTSRCSCDGRKTGRGSRGCQRGRIEGHWLRQAGDALIYLSAYLIVGNESALCATAMSLMVPSVMAATKAHFSPRRGLHAARTAKQDVADDRIRRD
jgi:hypothetical protein